MAVPTSATLEALERLSMDPRNIVYIISGRDQEFLEQHLGHLDRVGFSAEHGGFVRPPSGEWVNFTETLDMEWMGEVMEIFKYYTEVGFYSREGWSLGMRELMFSLLPFFCWTLCRGLLEVLLKRKRVRLRGIIGAVIQNGGGFFFQFFIQFY